MFSYIYNVITSTDPSKYWLRLLITLLIVLLCIYFYKGLNTKRFAEGFSQNEKFIMKQNNDIYDDFYVEIYDQLYDTETRSDYEARKIIESTQPSEQSVILDIGCGTGYLVNKLTELGYNAYGLDKSKAMIDIAEEKYPKCNFKCNDMTESLLYDQNTFSHLICTNFTIYHFKDKYAFAQKCYQWLVPNGYLIVHLVDKQKFSPIIPLGKPILLDNPQKYSNFRIKDTEIDFIDFYYKGSYNFDKINSSSVILTETFTDKSTSNVRQNELELYMDNIDVINYIFQKSGFVAHARYDMSECNGDDKQYIYIYEKI